MIVRAPRMRFLLIACLVVDGVGLVAWALLDRVWFSQPFVRWETACLAGCCLFAFLMAVALVVHFDRCRAALAENTEAKFRSLLESAPDPILIMNGEGRVTLVNARAEQLFGYPRAEILGGPVDTLLTQSSVEGEFTDSTLAAYPDFGTKVASDIPAVQARRKDGVWVPVELSFSPLETTEGLLTMSIIRDISERKRVDKLRHARHAVRRALAEGADVADVIPGLLETLCKALRLDMGVLWTLDARSDVLRFGSCWRSADVGHAFQEASRFATYASGVGLPGVAWADGKPACLGDFRDGEEGPQKAFAFPVLFNTETLGVIECFSHDPQEYDDAFRETLQSIGSQVGRFIKHRHAEEAVRESEARKAAILEAAVDAVITLDGAGKVVEWNPAAERIFGRTRGEAVGLEMTQFLASPANQAPNLRNLFGALPAASVSPGCERTELTLTRRDGTAIPVELAVTQIRSKGEPLFTCYIRDLTERKQSEKALERAEGNLRQAQKMEAVGRLAGGVAHDFNNILTVITGYSHQLLGALGTESPHRFAIESISKSATRAATLTRQLLAFSRRQVLATKALDLNTTVAEMGKMLLRLIGEDIDLVTLPAANLSPIKADPGQIEQVIMNLAVNARDAMPDGGKITIETRNVELDESHRKTHPEVCPGSYVMLAISDTGVGMDGPTKERVFEPFFTTKEVGQGTGLGLATVYGIVKQSNGHIAVYSEPGKGSSFKIYLPASDKKPVSEAAICLAPLPAGKGTILLVEDEEMVRKLSGDILRKQGYIVKEARHGADALRLGEAALRDVDLTVTDVVMPEMGGRDLALHLLGRKPSMKVLYMSGYTDNAIFRNGLLEAGEAFLEKPFSPESLARKVHELMIA